MAIRNIKNGNGAVAGTVVTIYSTVFARGRDRCMPQLFSDAFTVYRKWPKPAGLEIDLFAVKCRGQLPAEADFYLLDTARKVELYGIRRLPARVS